MGTILYWNVLDSAEGPRNSVEQDKGNMGYEELTDRNLERNQTQQEAS